MYLIEALRAVLPGIGEAALAMLRAPGVSLVDDALLPLVNELVDVSEQFVLVLDDYHAIEDERIHRGHGLALIEHLPSTLRIVMTSRVEPPLRIGTLRARGQLNEIDAAQLRFSRSEAESMLNDVHGLGLTSEIVSAPARPHRGLGSGPLSGRSVDARARGCERLRRVVHGQRSTGRRLSRRRGARLSSPMRSWHFLLHTGAARPVLRALCATPSRARRDSRAMLDRIERVELLPDPARPKSRLVPLSPPVRRAAASRARAQTAGTRGGAP